MVNYKIWIIALKTNKYKEINLNNSNDCIFMIINLDGNPDEFNVYSVVYNYLKMNID